MTLMTIALETRPIRVARAAARVRGRSDER